MEHIESVLIILYTPEIWIAGMSHCAKNFVVYLQQRLSREKKTAAAAHKQFFIYQMLCIH